MVGAAVRKPRVPNDKLHRVTDNITYTKFRREGGLKRSGGLYKTFLAQKRTTAVMVIESKRPLVLSA